MSEQHPQRREAPTLDDTLTHGNLEEALSDDARRAQLLRAFADIAEIEGYPELGRLMGNLAEQHELFAQGHLDFLRRVPDRLTRRRLGDTLRNLGVALAHDQLRSAETLPEMARTAHHEGFPAIASWFESLAHARRDSAEQLAAALEGAKKDAE